MSNNNTYLNLVTRAGAVLLGYNLSEWYFFNGTFNTQVALYALFTLAVSLVASFADGWQKAKAEAR